MPSLVLVAIKSVLKETGARAAIYGRVAPEEGAVTSVAGVLAAGEVAADGRYRRTAEAAGDDRRAAVVAQRWWLEEQGERAVGPKASEK